MSILVTVTDSAEGEASLRAGIHEARALREPMVVLNLGLRALDLSAVPHDLTVRTVERHGKEDRDPVEVVLNTAADDPSITRIVIGMRRRSPVGKAVLGSVSQGILLESPLPVLAVKAD